MTTLAKFDLERVSLLWQQLRQDPIRGQCWQQLSGLYLQAGMAWQAGYTLQQLNRIDRRLIQNDVVLLNASQQRATFDANGLLGQAKLPGFQERIPAFLAWLDQAPGDWITWLYLARLFELAASDRSLAWPTVDDAIAKARGFEPIPGESLHWLGVWRLNAGDVAGAIDCFSQLLAIRPVRTGSMLFLGEALLQSGQRLAAEKAFSRASLSNNVSFLRELAQRVYDHNYWNEALEILAKARQIEPDSVATLLAISTIHWEVYNLSEAQAICNRILDIDPNNNDVGYMLSALPGRMGDAKAHFEAVLAKFDQVQDPTSRLASSIAMASLYQDDLSAQQVADLHLRLCAPIESALAAQHRAVMALPRGKRLRIGLVSGDFHRQHPVNLFMLPVLQRLDHGAFELFVYHTGTMHDEYTLKAKACSDHWLEAAKLDDHALVQQIQRDGVQLLLDLAGHTSSHRLGVFSLRAAPVQATFLGYPHSTGLASMDWLIGDRWVSPAEHHGLFSEGLAQLPGSVFCWSPVDVYPLPPPRPVDGPAVFGSFNNVMKLTPHTLRLWAQILHAVPDSKLLLKAPSLRDAAVCDRFRWLFGEHHIDPSRLEFQGPNELGEMMQCYGEIDIALDPTPYNGGTTSLQALWMGVPLISLVGHNFVSRMGTSFLHSLDRSEWLAKSDDDYVRIAQELAGQVGDIRSMRPLLRQQMAASSLSDIDRYVVNFQALLERMWQAHEGATGERLLVLDWPRSQP
jgi:tetratricopeptide (TPR) repeat protein